MVFSRKYLLDFPMFTRPGVSVVEVKIGFFVFRVSVFQQKSLKILFFLKNFLNIFSIFTMEDYNV